MSTTNKSGVAYTTPPNVTGSGAVNNGGSSTRIRSTSLLKTVSVSKNTTGVFGSTVIDGPDTNKAISGGPIAHDHVKPLTARVTTEIAGVSSNVLKNTGNVPGQLRGINKRESYKSDGKSTAFRAGYFNLYTGEYNPAATAVTEVPGTDNAAVVSRTSPGDLVFRTGAKLPVRNRDYSKKTG